MHFPCAQVLWKSAMIATAIVAAAQGSVRGPDDRDRLRAIQLWLDAEIERARERPAVAGFAVRFDLLYHAEVTRDELRSLKVEIAGKPDHPALPKIAAHERRLSSGPDRVAWTVWFLSPERWRINKTAQYPAGIPFTDHGRDTSAAWVLQNDSLVVIDADQPPANRDYAAHDGIARMHLEALFYAGFGPGRGEASLSNLTVNGEEWTARRTVTLSPGMEIVIDLAGRWDAAAGRGFVESRRVAASPHVQTIGMRWENSGWHRDQTLGAWVSKRVDQIAPDGRYIESLEWRGAQPVSESQIEAMTAVPDPLAADAVRGPLNIRTVSDYRANVGLFKFVDDDGTIRSQRLEPGRPRRNVQWVGWLLASAILASLVYIRARRAAQAA